MRSRLLLSAQRALLGRVTPRIRGVAAGSREEGGILRVGLIAFYGELPTGEEERLLTAAVNDIVADFPEARGTFEDARIVASPRPLELPGGFEWVYRVHEPAAHGFAEGGAEDDGEEDDAFRLSGIRYAAVGRSIAPTLKDLVALARRIEEGGVSPDELRSATEMLVDVAGSTDDAAVLEQALYDLVLAFTTARAPRTLSLAPIVARLPVLDRQLLPYVLEVIGASADPRHLPLVERYFDDPDAEVREAAQRAALELRARM
jgi:hypothetical protein